MTKIADIYQVNSSAVYWAAYGITLDDHTAMDITQTVFLRALEHEGVLVRLEPVQARAWLLTTARNACMDYFRKRRREVIVEEPMPQDTQDYGPLPEDFVMTAQMKETLRAAIKKLPSIYQQPVLLYYFAQMRQNEIAGYLHVNESTLRTRMKRAREQLYSLLQEGEILNG